MYSGVHFYDGSAIVLLFRYQWW